MRAVSEERIESRNRLFTWIVVLIFGALAVLFGVTLLGRSRDKADLQAEMAAARKMGIPLGYDEYYERVYGKPASSELPTYVKILGPFFENDKLVQKLVATRTELRNALNGYTSDPAGKVGLVKALRRTIEPYRSFLEATKRAVSLPEWPYYKGRFEDSPANHLWNNGVTYASTLLMASAVIRVEEGDWTSAVDDLRSAYSLGNKLSGDHSYLSLARARNDLPRLMHLQRLFAANKTCPPEILKEMLELGRLDLKFPLPSQLFELNHVEIFTDFLSAKTAADYIDFESNPYERMIDSFGKPAISIDEAQAIWLRAVRKVYRSVDMPNASYTDLATAIRRYAPPADSAIESLFPSSFGGYGVMSSVAELLAEAEGVTKTILSERRLTEAYLIALLEYRRTGAFPKLLPLKGKDSIDPFTHKPYRYRLTKDGFIAYSLGKGGLDDGGKEVSSAHPSADDIAVIFPPEPMELQRY